MATPTIDPPWASDPGNISYGAQKTKKNYQDVDIINPDTDVSAEQYVTLADHTRAAVSVAAFAELEATLDDAGMGDPDITFYKSMVGIGLSYAPTATRGGDGYATFTWDSTYDDFYEQSGAVNITAARAVVNGASPGFATCVVEDGQTVTVYAWDNDGAAFSDAQIHLSVWTRGT